MRKALRVCLCLSIVAFCLSGCFEGKPKLPEQPASLSYDDLVKPLIDVGGLENSRPGTRYLQTSYDRTGKNDDYGYYSEKLPDGRGVIADFEGPGCVHRLWFTGVGNDRRFSFYFDDETQPRLVMTAVQILQNNRPPFLAPLAQYLSGGNFSFVPIPFKKRLKITLDTNPDDRQYCQFNWSKYQPGTVVPDFRPDDPALQAACERVRESWTLNRFHFEVPASGQPAVLAPGSTATVLSEKGPATIEAFSIEPVYGEKTGALDRNSTMRDIVLRIYWDGKSKPSVEVPLGDFFCNPWRQRRFESAPLECTNGVYYCRFPMPFRKGARITLSNDGNVPLEIKTGFKISRGGSAGSGRYFHSEWRLTDPNTRPHVVLNAKGAGHYVGCFLTVTDIDGSWMILEGDDQIFIDGEQKASMHGTGLEDYFNGGWYYSGLYHRALAGLVECTPIRTAQYRFHSPDPVDFKTGITVRFEKGSENVNAGFFSSVAYWYQDRPSEVVSLPSTMARHSDVDPMDRFTILAGLLELERIGHYDEAAVLCDEYAAKLPNTLDAWLLGIRKVAYLEKLSGFDAVKNMYEFFAGNPDSRISSQAKLLLDYGNNTDAVLLGVHTTGSHELFLDGKKIGSGTGHLEMQAYPAEMKPGTYLLAAKVPYEKNESWFSMYIRSHRTNMWTDVSWKVSYEALPGWEQPGFDDSGWTNASLKGRIPCLGWYSFAVNAYVDMQSPIHNIRPVDWNSVRKTAYFRKTITIP